MKKMEKADRSGLMVQFMKAGGQMIKQMAVAVSFMVMVMSTKENGSMTKLTLKVSTPILMEPNIQVAGKRINSTVMVLRHGQIRLDMKAIMLMEGKKERANLHGQMALTLMESSWITIFMAKVSIIGVMVEDMREIGATTRCMAMEYSHGVMEESIKESMSMIKKKEKGDLNGQIIDNILVNGRMESNMATENILTKKEIQEREFGRTVKEYNGSRRMLNNDLKMRFISDAGGAYKFLLLL